MFDDVSEGGSEKDRRKGCDGDRHVEGGAAKEAGAYRRAGVRTLKHHTVNCNRRRTARRVQR